MEQKMYMTTGELARLMGITKETLFHYDEIGLFQPEIVKENGYRYYAIYQMEVLNTILLLRDLGMPLKEIKFTLEERSLDKMMQIFQDREQQIQKELVKLRNMKEWIRKHRQKMQLAYQMDWNLVHVQKLSERYYVYREVPDGTEEAIYKKENELLTQFLDVNPQFCSDYEVAYMQHAENVECGAYHKYDNAVLLLDKRPRKLSCQILKAGDYLTAYHVGHWRNIGEAYKRLKEYQQEQNLGVDGMYLERYLVDGLTEKEIDQYVTEISVRLIN